MGALRRFSTGSSYFLRQGGTVARKSGGARPWLVGLLLAGGSLGCTLITDVDRDKIPVTTLPPFPEVDAGPQPPIVVSDASAPDAAGPADAGDGSDAALPADAGDAATPSGDAG